MLMKTLIILLVLIGLAVPIAAALGWLGLILQFTESPMPLHRAISDMAWPASPGIRLVAIPAGLVARWLDALQHWLFCLVRGNLRLVRGNGGDHRYSCGAPDRQTGL